MYHACALPSCSEFLVHYSTQAWGPGKDVEFQAQKVKQNRLQAPAPETILSVSLDGRSASLKAQHGCSAKGPSTQVARHLPKTIVTRPFMEALHKAVLFCVPRIRVL